MHFRAPRLSAVCTPLLILCLIAGCTTGSGAPAAGSPAPTAANQLIVPTAVPGQMSAVLANSDLAVGPNRFLIALLDDRNQPITDADLRLRFFTLEGNTGTFRFEVPATLRRSGDKSIYSAQPEFDQAGTWGVEAIASRGQETKTVRTQFPVQQQSKTPALGALAPRSQTPTATDQAGLDLICTANPHDDMHTLTVAQAVTSGKPSVIFFGTPAYCSSRTCGPALEIVEALEQKYRDRVNFVHVEIYEGLRPGPFVPAVREWNLPSDPWVFVIDREGQVSAKFESIISAEELDPAIAKTVT